MRGTGAVVLVVLAGTAGCGAAPRPPAPALRAGLPDLAPSRMPVHLPASPPAPPRGQRYLVTAQATPGTYQVEFGWTDASGATSFAGTVGFIRGGPAGSLDAQAQRDTGVPAGPPPAGSVAWREGGWPFEVVGVPAEVAQVAATLRAEVGDASPVPASAHNEVRRSFGADGGDEAVVWTRAGHDYAVWTQVGDAVVLARAMVRVSAR